MRYRCGALNKSGSQCSADAVEANDYWRCERHTDWHRDSTPQERQKLARLEIQALIKEVRQHDEDLDTRR